jgi:methoxymalonate biosynthesis acyl carrier protein
MESIKIKLRAFLQKHFRDYRLKDDEDIFAVGYVSSMFAMQMVLFVEKEFSMTIDNEDLKLDNFRTIEALARLIGRKQGST